MENKKNNTMFYMVIVILIIIIALLIGFIVDKELLSNASKTDPEIIDSNNQEDTKENEDKVDEIVSLSEVEKEDLFHKVSVYNNYFLKIYSSNGLKNASNNDILYFLVGNLEGFGDNIAEKGFTPQDLQKIANEYLPNDIKISYTDIYFRDSGINHLVFYKLGEDGKYSFNEDLPGMGGDGYYYMKEFYIDGTYNKTQDIYTINTKLLFNQWCSDTCETGFGSFYSDSALENVVYTNDTDNGMSLESVYEIVKGKLPITSYTFEKNNSGNYVLTSVVTK